MITPRPRRGKADPSDDADARYEKALLLMIANWVAKQAEAAARKEGAPSVLSDEIPKKIPNMALEGAAAAKRKKTGLWPSPCL